MFALKPGNGEHLCRLSAERKTPRIIAHYGLLLLAS